MKFEYSAGAIIYRKVKDTIQFLILIKNNGEPDLAKGHIEKGESSEVAARREIMEETGIKAEFLPFFYAKTRYFFRADNVTIHKEVKLFIADAGTQKAKISNEHKAYKWLDYDQTTKIMKYKDMKKVLPLVFGYIGKWERMKELNEEYAQLPRKAKGWDLSKNHVRGEGRLDAKLMILGQAPGRNEDVQRRPFIGRSGKLLGSILKKNKIRREEAYITSVVQFFPAANRMPTREEVETCKPFLFRQIEIIRPKYVVLLGNLASTSVLGIGEVETNHGKIIERDGITYMITLHPAAALRSTTSLGLMEGDFEKLSRLI